MTPGRQWSALLSALAKSLRVGIVLGLAIAVVFALVICVWEWIENPGGIFHDANGTNWQFVYDTGISWLIPMFPTFAILAGVSHYLFSRFSSDKGGQ